MCCVCVCHCDHYKHNTVGFIFGSVYWRRGNIGHTQVEIQSQMVHNTVNIVSLTIPSPSLSANVLCSKRLSVSVMHCSIPSFSFTTPNTVYNKTCAIRIIVSYLSFDWLCCLSNRTLPTNTSNSWTWCVSTAQPSHTDHNNKGSHSTLIHSIVGARNLIPYPFLVCLFYV